MRKMSIKWPRGPVFSASTHLRATKKLFLEALFETFRSYKPFKTSAKRMYFEQLEIKSLRKLKTQIERNTV